MISSRENAVIATRRLRVCGINILRIIGRVNFLYWNDLRKGVILVDADLGGANLHTFLGVSPPAFTLSDFIKKRVKNLHEVLIPTEVPNLFLLTGAQDLLNAMDSKNVQKRKLMRSIERVRLPFKIPMNSSRR